jgi:hypothetical protein
MIPKKAAAPLPTRKREGKPTRTCCAGVMIQRNVGREDSTSYRMLRMYAIDSIAIQPVDEDDDDTPLVLC